MHCYNDFEFVRGSQISSMDFDEIKKSTNDLAIECATELGSELECLKRHASAVMVNFKTVDRFIKTHS